MKNNLQLISSLAGLQSKQLEDSRALDSLQDIRQRIQSMAIVHKMLYSTDALLSLPIKDYIRELTQSIVNSFEGKKKVVELDFELESDRDLPLDTVVPFGLVISELLTNSLKHAVRVDEKSHDIDIGFREFDGESFEFTLSDRGPGLPDEVDPSTSDSLGMKLIHNLIENQLKGEYSINREGGTSVQVQFPAKNVSWQGS